MPRRALGAASGLIFHVLNRSVRRERLFSDEGDYQAFETVLAQALKRIPTRLLAYCVMPNHWHMVLWPSAKELPSFMHWLTLTHAKRWHLAKRSSGTGHVYPNRYTAVPVQTDQHLLTLLRYVERNALSAQLVEHAEDWQWCSLWRRCNSCKDLSLAPWPIPQPEGWTEIVNMPQTERELQNIQAAVRRGHPLGNPEWTAATAARLGLSLRSRGRPRK